MNLQRTPNYIFPMLISNPFPVLNAGEGLGPKGRGIHCCNCFHSVWNPDHRAKWIACVLVYFYFFTERCSLCCLYNLRNKGCEDWFTITKSGSGTNQQKQPQENPQIQQAERGNSGTVCVAATYKEAPKFTLLNIYWTFLFWVYFIICSFSAN